jgi:hypothetical protein
MQLKVWLPDVTDLRPHSDAVFKDARVTPPFQAQHKYQTDLIDRHLDSPALARLK